MNTLTANTNFDIVVQSLPVNLPIYLTPPRLSVEGPTAVTFALNTDFLGYNYGASGNVAARTQVRARLASQTQTETHTDTDCLTV